MGSLSPAQATALADSYAKSLIDINSALVLGPQATVVAINAGLASATPSAVGRIINLLDSGLELTLLPSAARVANSVAGSLASSATLTTYYPLYAPVMDALETATAGFAAYLASNGLQVHSYFAAAFNYYAANAQALGLRPVSTVIVPIAPAQIFVLAAQTLGSITIGAGFAAGTAINTSAYGPAPLNLQVLAQPGGSPTPSTIKATYIPSAGAAASTVTTTPTLPGPGNTPGPLLPLGVSGVSVSTIVVVTPGTDTAAVYAVVASPTRTIATY